MINAIHLKVRQLKRLSSFIVTARDWTDIHTRKETVTYKMYEVSAVVFYVPLLLCCNAKVLLDCTLQPWGSTIWSQHTDTMLHWCMPLALLKLQVLLRKEFLQCGHILSPRMFKSWDRSSVQTSCAGVFFSLCLSLSLPCFFLFFPHTAFFLCLRPLPPTPISWWNQNIP